MHYKYSSWQLLELQLEMESVGWLSIGQLIIFLTVLQAHKTSSTGIPRCLFSDLSSEYTSEGRIRQQGGTSTATFKFRATKYYNSVPIEVRTGSMAAAKLKLKK